MVTFMSPPHSVPSGSSTVAVREAEKLAGSHEVWSSDQFGRLPVTCSMLTGGTGPSAAHTIDIRLPTGRFSALIRNIYWRSTSSRFWNVKSCWYCGGEALSTTLTLRHETAGLSNTHLTYSSLELNDSGSGLGFCSVVICATKQKCPGCCGVHSKALSPTTTPPGRRASSLR